MNTPSPARIEEPSLPFSASSPRVKRGQIIAYAAMVVGMFLALLDVQIISASLPDIQAGLSASPEEISWVQTSYLIAEVIMIPFSGFLSRMMSTRLLFCFSAIGFTLASALCASASSIEQMIVYRALQGFLGGGMIPAVFAVGFTIFPLKQRALVSTCIGLMATLAPTIGPAVGGFINHYFSWHWLFWINLLPGLTITLISWKWADFDEPDWSLGKQFDWWGFIGMAVTLGCLQYILEEGPRKDWLDDKIIAFFTLVVILAAILFFWRAFTAKQPIVELRAFYNRNFGFGSLFSFILGIGLFGLVYLYPLYLSRIRGYDSLMIGKTMFISGLFMLASAPLVGFLITRIDQRILIGIGAAGFGLGTWLVAVGMTSDWDYWELFIPQMLRGVCAVMSLVPISNIALGALPPHQLKNASALFNLMRNLGGAVGLAFINTLLTRRSELHYAHLSEALHWGSLEATEVLKTLSMRMNTIAAQAEIAALQQLRNMTQKQALVMAFIDVFSILTLFFIILVAVVPIFKKTHHQARTYESDPRAVG